MATGTNSSNPEYSKLSARAQEIVDNLMPPHDEIEKRVKYFSYVKPRNPDTEGSTEILDGVEFTHHFVDTPGDYEFVRFHYVTAGPSSGEAIVFLHGIPDSWFQFHHQMAALSKEGYHCVSVDLKGYGQSEKKPGDYRHEGVAEQLYNMLQQIGLKKFNLVTHDRGTVQADYIAAHHPESVLRYGRGEQHLYHFNPLLAPQGDIFMNAPWTGEMEDPLKFVLFVHTWVCKYQLSDEVTERTIQEFSYDRVTRAVPRYFNSSSFRAEWLDRRNRLLAKWTCPVMIMEGYDSKTQPREFYENSKEYIPNAKDVKVTLIPGGHFWPQESPEETTKAIKELLKM